MKISASKIVRGVLSVAEGGANWICVVRSAHVDTRRKVIMTFQFFSLYKEKFVSFQFSISVGNILPKQLTKKTGEKCQARGKMRRQTYGLKKKLWQDMTRAKFFAPTIIMIFRCDK